MQMLWVNSKITVPRVMDEIVKRDRLNNLLQQNDAKRITIVRAPAGYGKTTMLSWWCGVLEEPVAWMSVDTTDNDPIRFWKYVVHAVSEATHTNIDAVLSSLFNSQEASTFEFLIDSFLHELNIIKGNIHIVMDDYHLIENPTIHQMMVQLVEHLPGHVQIYMLSRTELALPIAKWRVKSWIKEINMEQLRFTIEEAERFYQKNSLLTNDTKFFQHAWEMTEGWAAGLQLVGLSMRDSAIRELAMDTIDGTHPFITDFLLQEILAALPEETQDFLVRTSLLNSLEPAICDAITDRLDSYDVLLELEHKGLFIVRLHASEPNFRYHHLFAEALQVELRNRYSKAKISALVKTVATLIHDKGDFISAIELALDYQDYDLAESWITDHLVELFTSGQTSTFMRWVQVFQSNHHLVPHEMLVMDIIALISILNFEEASKLVQELEYRQLTEQWMDQEEHQGIAIIYENVKAYALFSMGEDTEKIGEIVQKQLDKGHVSTRWDDIPMRFNLFEPNILRTSLGAKGKLLSFEKSMPFAKLFRETIFKEQSVTAFSYGVSAETLYERNYMDAAWSEMELAITYGHQFNDPGLFIPMYILKSNIYMMKGQFVTAHAILDNAMEMVKEKYWINSLRTMKARCSIVEGDLVNAESELYIASSKQPFWQLVNAHFLLAKGQSTKALKIVIGVKMKARQEDQIATIIEAAVLEAVCEMSLENEEAALLALHEALELGSLYGYVRSFLDEERIIQLLQSYLEARQRNSNSKWGSVPVSYVEQLVANSDSKKSVLDLLTPRELEVFQMLAAGATNQEIADNLFLSEGTIRVYLSKIYSKLGVSSRTQAVLLK